ncbi:MAG: putative DNA-binding domain-containing protein [Archangium sp.]|nr:putative DNA-binding domain-containing protein [Archangium sp.]
MKLASFFETIAPYLEGRAGFETTSRALFGASPPSDAKRIAIYERFCRSHRQTALSVHALLRELVGAEKWKELVEAYFVEHPMQHVEINENGAQFAAWLGARAGVPKLWAALADFEWWEWQSIVAPDSADDAKPDEGPLRLGATVDVRPYAWDFVSWADADERAAEPEEREVLVLFWRNRNLDGRRALASREELLVLKAVSEGGEVERDETFDDLHRAGIILGAR